MINESRYIQLYKSSICPRCRQAERFLQSELEHYPDITLYSFDILRHPLLCLRKKITMIPTLITDRGQKLTGLMLKKHQIKIFLEENYAK